MTLHRYLSIALLLAAVASLGGCKLVVIMVAGGEVQSVSSGTCLQGVVCTHDITTTSYTETYTAVANTGWHFVKWNNGDEFLCADSTSPVCVVSNTGSAGNPVAEAIVASNTPVYLMPLFAPN